MSNEMADSPFRKPRSGCSVACGILGCLGIAALAGLGIIGVLIYAFIQGTATFGGVVDDYFDAMNREDYEQVYAMLSSGWHEKKSREDTLAELQMLRENLGKCESKRIVSVNVKSVNGTSRGSVVVKATFEEGKGAVEFSFVKEDDSWKIENITYDAPGLVPMLNAVQARQMMADTMGPAASLASHAGLLRENAEPIEV